MTDKPRRDSFWSFLSSVQLAIGLIACIALASIIGTVIPQQEGAQELISHLPSRLVSVLMKLQLFDIFHSSWFLLLLALLSLNLIVCSLRRLPLSIRRFRSSSSSVVLAGFKNLPADRTIVVNGEIDDEAQRMENIFRASFRRFAMEKEEGKYLFAGERGAWSSFSVYFVHLSILVIIAGALFGSLAGFDGFVAIPEGGAASSINLKDGGQKHPLGFSIRCDRFTVDFYESGMPKLYRSDVSLLRGERVLKHGAIMVNHPLEFEGIRLYQASFDTLPGGTAKLRIDDGKGNVTEHTRAAGDTFPLPGSLCEIRILRVENNIMNMGPAVKLAVVGKDGTKATLWIFQRIDEISRQNPGLLEHVPMFDPAFYKPYVFRLAGLENIYVTGLQVNKDPGAPLVAVGAIMLVLGVITTFYVSHRRIYVRMERERGKVRISAAGRCNRDQSGMQREIDRLLVRFQEGAKSA